MKVGDVVEVKDQRMPDDCNLGIIVDVRNVAEVRDDHWENRVPGYCVWTTDCRHLWVLGLQILGVVHESR